MGYDVDEHYIGLAERRVAFEGQPLADELRASSLRVSLTADQTRVKGDGGGDLQERAVREGRAAKEIARMVIAAAGFTEIEQDRRQAGAVDVSFSGRDPNGAAWFFDVAGGLTAHRPPLSRSETLWRAIGKAAVLRQAGDTPLVLLTAGLPARGSSAAKLLTTVCGADRPIYQVIDLLAPTVVECLQRLYSRGRSAAIETSFRENCRLTGDD